MKIWLLFIVILIGCSVGHINHAKAKALVETLEHKIGCGEFDDASNFYSGELNTSDLISKRREQLKNRHTLFGDLVSMECISVKDTVTAEDISCVNLAYRVHYANATCLELFTVVSEDSNYKISKHSVIQIN
jgi:hypothetical protein